MDRAGDLRAAACAVLAVTLFGVSDAVVKTLTAVHPPGQIMACRGAVGVLLLAALVLARRDGGGRGVWRDPACWARGAFEVAAAYSFLNALARLPIAEATALLFVFPVLLTVAAALVLRERVGAGRWAGVAAGLAGVLVILRPGAGAFEPASLWALAAAACVAGRDLASRFLRPGSPSAGVALASTCMTAAAGLASAPFVDWTPVGGGSALGFAASAGLVAAAFLALIEGTRTGSVSFTAPFRFVIVPLSFLIGWAVWGDAPDLAVVLGSLLVVAGAVLATLSRERRPAPA